jgi:hypothetical protein
VSFEAQLVKYVAAAAIYLLLICVPVGIYHLICRILKRKSGDFRPPRFGWLAVGAVATIVVSPLVRSEILDSILFLAAAALPALTALSLAAGRIGPVTTWRRVAAGILTGSTISVQLTILMSTGITAVVVALVIPLRALVDRILASGSLEELFYSPALAVAVIGAAIVAPMVEEFTKPLVVIPLARRLRGPAEAFLIGMACGAGFAIFENMMYQAIFGGFVGWTAIAVLRGFGGVLHPLNAGLVAMGWYSVRNREPGGWNRLLRLYGLAVGIHALWNGGFTLISAGIAEQFFGGEGWILTVAGVPDIGISAVFLLTYAIGLWILLLKVTDRLRPSVQPDARPVGLRLNQPGGLALWAAGVFVVVVSIGAVYGPILERYLTRFRLLE